MSSAVLLLLMLIALWVAISSDLAAADGVDDGWNSTATSTWIPTDTVATVGHSTDLLSTLSVENATYFTQPCEVTSPPSSSRTYDVRLRWFRVMLPILLALTTVGNPLSIITLQNPRFALFHSNQSSRSSELIPRTSRPQANPEPAVSQVVNKLYPQCAGSRRHWSHLHRSSASLCQVRVQFGFSTDFACCVQGPHLPYVLISPGISHSTIILSSSGGSRGMRGMQPHPPQLGQKFFERLYIGHV